MRSGGSPSRLQGKRVVHLSATAFGGGVAEINYTLVPLMADAGLEVEWRIIKGDEEFYNVTKAIHNALQGDPRSLGPEEIEIFKRYNALNAEEFAADDYDFVIVHDPQPVAMIDHFERRTAKWTWRGHIDFSTPNWEVFDLLLPSIRRYDAAVFHMREYVPKVAGLPETVIWPPAIDPLTPKNMALSPEDAQFIVDQFGIDVSRPLLTQVSRFDPWKDPLGVIDAYRMVKDSRPEVQLALVGSMAHDDPEGWDFYNRTVEYAANDPDIHILSQHEQRRRDRGERVPGALGGGDPEVDQGGLRPHRRGSALEGAADGRRARRRHRRPDRRRRHRLARRQPAGLRRGVSRDPRASGGGARPSRSAARRRCAGSS